MKFLFFGKKKPQTASVQTVGALSIEVCKELKQLSMSDPNKGQKLLRSTWANVLQDYRELATLAAQSDLRKYSSVMHMTALVVINSYFEHNGDWDKMVSSISERGQL